MITAQQKQGYNLYNPPSWIVVRQPPRIYSSSARQYDTWAGPQQAPSEEASTSRHFSPYL